MTVQKNRWFLVARRADINCGYLTNKTGREYCKALGNNQWIVWHGKKYSLPKTMTTAEMSAVWESVKDASGIGYVDSKTAGELDNQFSLVWE